MGKGDEKMLERGKMDRDLVEFVVIDQLVPKEHLLRKIDAAVDFTQLYEMVEPLYCEDNGRPSIDPVVLFKMVLIQHLYGLPSLRRTAEEVSANNCYRWFLGYPLQEETPHFSTVSYNFRHRFTEETVDRVFAWILDEVAKAGYLSPKAVFIDGTHIKANANTKKQVKEQIPAAARHYAKELMEEVNADREAHGKKPFDDDNDPPASPRKHKDNTSKKKLARRKKQGFRTVTKSVTDPDCGLFVKGEHKRQFAYEAHTACDKNGFVLETVVTPGNVHDSVAFDEVYDKVTENFPQVEAVVADAAYKTPHICKKVFDDGSRVIIDDYAHHPDELKASIRSIRELYPDRRLTVAFQPHLYTRTRDFAEGFARALSVADEVILLDIYPAREQPIPGVTSRIIFDRITTGKKVLIPLSDLISTVKSSNFELLLTAGAGSIGTEVPRLAESLQ